MLSAQRTDPVAPGTDLINSDFINHRDQLPRHPEEFGALIENRNNRKRDPSPLSPGTLFV
jgi:hypothetical protein